MIAMVKLRHVPSDKKLSLRGEALHAAIEQDRNRGLVPFFVSSYLHEIDQANTKLFNDSKTCRRRSR